MPGTPIDAANSSFTNGPAGQQAYPFGNPPDDRVASTQWGPASVAALDPFPPQMVFTETTSPAGSGWPSAVTRPVSSTRPTARPSADPSYSYLDTSPVSIGKGETIDLMAAYRVVNISPPAARTHPHRLHHLLRMAARLRPSRRPVRPAVQSVRTRADRLRVGALTDLFALTRMAEGPRTCSSRLGECEVAEPSGVEAGPRLGKGDFAPSGGSDESTRSRDGAGRESRKT